MFKRTGAPVPIKKGRDVWWQEAMMKEEEVCPCAHMQSNDSLFVLYTSGSTGKPKGIVQSTAGPYLESYLPMQHVHFLAVVFALLFLSLYCNPTGLSMFVRFFFSQATC